MHKQGAIFNIDPACPVGHCFPHRGFPLCHKLYLLEFSVNAQIIQVFQDDITYLPGIAFSHGRGLWISADSSIVHMKNAKITGNFFEDRLHFVFIGMGYKYLPEMIIGNQSDDLPDP